MRKVRVEFRVHRNVVFYTGASEAGLLAKKGGDDILSMPLSDFLVYAHYLLPVLKKMNAAEPENEPACIDGI
jgi:hypothetical protein